ncbi:MAG: Proton/sodium-glutamate symport protein [Chlamydiae bacterium]|nr:Proton/sodium-glutamate symport protein [Chlamydiota bacterium]
MKLWAKILLGMLLGLIVGSIFGSKAVFLKPVGQIFLNMIGMLILPLIFASMTVGITSIKDPVKLGRVGLKTLALYMATTGLAIVIGLFFAYLFKPGLNVGFVPSTPIETSSEISGFSEMILNIVPSNPFESFSSGNILQVIVFAVFVGLAIQFSGEKGKPFLKFLESVSEVMYTLTGIVMKFAPFGVFAIMASISGTFGLSILIPLAKLLGTIYIASFLQFFIVFSVILIFLCRLNPIPFFKGMIEAIVLAFSTSSSSATVPVTIHCTQHNLGVSKNIACFVVPLGSTINMNGTAIFQGIAALFVAQMYGIELGLQNLILIVLTATLSAVGTAGIPGAGFIVLSMVLKSVGLPLEGLAIIFAIDRLRDMVGTVVNIVGDAVVAVYVAKTEGELDIAQYNNTEIIALENSKAL